MNQRRLTGLTGRQIVKALERSGFEVVRASGSHHVLARSGASGARIIVPVDGANDLPPGTVRSIIKQAGLTVEAFTDLL